MKRRRSVSDDPINKSSKPNDDSSYIVEHFVLFQNNVEPSHRRQRGPLLVQPQELPLVENGHRGRHYKATKDGRDHIHMSTMFPWKHNLERGFDFSKIKSLKISITGRALPNATDETDDHLSGEAISGAAAIGRMKRLEELTIRFRNSAAIPKETKTRLLEFLLGSLKNSGNVLRRLKIKRMPFTDKDTQSLTFYVTENASLEELELVACFEPGDTRQLKNFFEPLIGKNSLKSLILTKIKLPFDVNFCFDPPIKTQPLWKFIEETTRLETLRLGLTHLDRLRLGSKHWTGDIRSNEFQTIGHLVELTRNHPTLREIIFPRMRWYFDGYISPVEINNKYTDWIYDSPPYAVLCPSQLSWLCNNEWSRFEVEDWVACIESCKSTRVLGGGVFSGEQKEMLVTTMERINAESLTLESSNMTISNVINFLTRVSSLKELILRKNIANIRGFMHLVPYLSTNTTLTSLDMSESTISFRENGEIAGLCYLIENNSTLNRLDLRSASFSFICDTSESEERRCEERYESMLKDMIRSIKRNCKLWQCNIELCGSMSLSFFLYHPL